MPGIVKSLNAKLPLTSKGTMPLPPARLRKEDHAKHYLNAVVSGCVTKFGKMILNQEYQEAKVKILAKKPRSAWGEAVESMLLTEVEASIQHNVNKAVSPMV
jgi:hypothetical protein